MDLQALPTLDQIRAGQLLSPLHLAELEHWFLSSLQAQKPLDLSPTLERELSRLILLCDLPETNPQ